MQKRTREILALALLGLLAIVAAGAMGYYMLVGHNWNVAASNIDDSIGQMDGYTVFLYEGMGSEPVKVTTSSSSTASESLPGKQSSSSSSGSPSEQAELPDEALAEEQTPASTDSVPEEQSTSSSFVTSAEQDATSTSSSEGEEEVAMSFEDVVKSYREKGAVVFVLDVTDLAFYNDPIIVEKPGKRVGIFSNLKPYRKTVARKAVRDLGLYGAKCFVELTDDMVVDESDTRGVTVLVSTDQENMLTRGEYVGSAYCVGVPYEGKVQAIIMSPSGVLSTKTIAEL